MLPKQQGLIMERRFWSETRAKNSAASYVHTLSGIVFCSLGSLLQSLDVVNSDAARLREQNFTLIRENAVSETLSLDEDHASPFACAAYNPAAVKVVVIVLCSFPHRNLPLRIVS